MVTRKIRKFASFANLNLMNKYKNNKIVNNKYKNNEKKRTELIIYLFHSTFINLIEFNN